MRQWRYITAICLLGFACLSWGAPVSVNGLRMWPAPDNTRLVFDVDAPVEYSVFTLDNPQRVVIDIRGTRLAGELPAFDLDKTVIQKIRSGPRNNSSDLRVVIDLKTAVTPKSFTLKPYQDYGHRLVIDLYDDGKSKSAPPVIAEHGNKAKPSAGSPAQEPRDIVIAIDAGHGGEDPGAKGYKGTYEKDVVLAIARRLHRLINREAGMRAVLIRDGDYFIPLRERMEKARAMKADLFVSIHADAFRDRRARGSSVYVLSQRGASSEAARWLATSENKSDLIGGVKLDDKDDMLASVLLDLSQTASIEASLEAGEQVLKQLKKVGKVHKPHVQQAGFAVLKSPDIPSILVETAFISNPREERKLTSSRYQSAMASAILNGVRGYFSKFPPVGTRIAMKQHVIARGDTLSEIAERYNVSMEHLRDANDLKSDTLHVGQVLRIPRFDS
jgi:N-acetylmuramoyl-L-alanine amidase